MISMLAEDETYVIPVALALLESSTRKAECALPCASLGSIFGQRKLSLVAVPVTDEVDGLAVGGGAESEAKLNGGHFELLGFKK